MNWCSTYLRQSFVLFLFDCFYTSDWCNTFHTLIYLTVLSYFLQLLYLLLYFLFCCIYSDIFWTKTFVPLFNWYATLQHQHLERLFLVLFFFLCLKSVYIMCVIALKLIFFSFTYCVITYITMGKLYSQKQHLGRTIFPEWKKKKQKCLCHYSLLSLLITVICFRATHNPYENDLFRDSEDEQINILVIGKDGLAQDLEDKIKVSVFRLFSFFF